MTTFDVVSEDKGGYRLPEVQHPNFVDICDRSTDVKSGFVWACTKYIVLRSLSCRFC